MLKLNQQSISFIENCINEDKDKKGPLKLILHKIQNELGYIPFEAMKKISESINIPISDIYGVVTFYSQFTLKPKGKNLINVCMGTACYVKNSENLLNNISKITNTKVNQTSDDGLFSIDATRCLGACGLAPVVIINNKVYGNTNINKDYEKVLKELISNSKKVEDNYEKC